MIGKQEKSEFIKTLNRLYLPIPENAGQTSKWQDVEIIENNEPLVPLGIGTEYPQLFTSSIYFGQRNDSPYFDERFDGSLQTMFVRKSVAEQCISAQNLLPECHYLVIYDAYRSFQVQQSLYNRYKEKLVIQNPEWPSEIVEIETQKFVSQPSTDKTKPSPHNTGGAIDLVICRVPVEIDKQIIEIRAKEKQSNDLSERLFLQAKRTYLLAQNAISLNFGTPFDYGGTEAHLKHFEELSKKRKLDKIEFEAMQNRRLLFNILNLNGFQGFEGEWWHFNSNKTQMGARSLGIHTAEYGPSELSADNLSHERRSRKYLRRIKHIGTLSSENQQKLEPYELYDIFIKSAISLGDINNTTLEPAVTIVPPDK